MKLTLCELRRLVRWELELFETDIVKLAARGGKDKGIVFAIDDLNDEVTHVIIIDDSPDADTSVKGAAAVQRRDDVQVPAKYTKKKLPAWQIITLWASDASTALTLLAACLNKFEAILPDSNVSPAAQAVIRRYYEKNKDDRSMVMRDVIKTDKLPDFLRAIYLGPVGGTGMSMLKWLGDVFVSNKVNPQDHWQRDKEAVVSSLVQAAKRGFSKSYANPKKTGYGGWSDILKKDFGTFVDKAYMTYDSADDDEIEELKKFVRAYRDEIIREFIRQRPENPLEDDHLEGLENTFRDAKVAMPTHSEIPRRNPLGNPTDDSQETNTLRPE